MTANVDTQLIQRGALVTYSISNKTGGPNSSPTPDITPPVFCNAFTVTTKRTGGNTAGFFKKRFSQRLKPTSFEFSKIIELGEAGSNQEISQNSPNTYGWGSMTQTGQNGGHNITTFRGASNAEINDLLDQVNSKLLAAIKSQSINAAQVIGERKQTARLIGDTAIRIASALRALRKGDIHTAARAIAVSAPKRAASRFKRDFPIRPGEAVSRAWLELQYGWKPLLSDVFGACEQIAKNENRVTYETKTSSRKIAIDLSKRTQTKTGQNCVSVQDIHGKLQIFAKVSVTYSNPSPEMSLPAQLGLTNPLAVAWELLPFSFVVDWFLPVGQFIGNLDATRGLEFYSGYQTVFYKSIANSVRTTNGIDQYNVLHNMRYESAASIVYCKRTPLAGFPANSIPRFKNPGSVIHALNGIALLTQLFGRK